MAEISLMTPADLRLYHNPRCSKSRAALALLAERGVHPDLVLYLERGLTLAEVKQLQQKAGVASLRELMRSGEDEYKALGLASVDEETLAAALVAHPRLLERPLLVAGDRARVGRPAERRRVEHAVREYHPAARAAPLSRRSRTRAPD